MKCKLHTDNWEDLGIEFLVHAYQTRPNSSAAEMSLELPDGTMVTRVIDKNHIEWIEDED